MIYAKLQESNDSFFNRLKVLLIIRLIGKTIYLHLYEGRLSATTLVDAELDDGD